MDDTIGSPALWAGFIALILGLLGIDLFLHRNAHEVKVREAVVWTIVWITLGVAFGVVVWVWKGADAGLAYYAGYLVEKSLSVDNIFVFVMLFGLLSVPKADEHRILFWGVVGAIVLRAIFVLAGAELLMHFHWAVIPLGLFLVVTGLRMMLKKEEAPTEGRLLTFLRKHIRSPFVLAVVAIELTDVLFAVDSVPAVFAVTDDAFIVFTSNIFALLGLRSLYFVLSGALSKLHYLKVGLSLVLMFVGVKMLAGPWFKIPIGISLATIAVLITGSVVASFIRNRRQASTQLATT